MVDMSVKSDILRMYMFNINNFINTSLLKGEVIEISKPLQQISMAIFFYIQHLVLIYDLTIIFLDQYQAQAKRRKQQIKVKRNYISKFWANVLNWLLEKTA